MEANTIEMPSRAKREGQDNKKSFPVAGFAGAGIAICIVGVLGVVLLSSGDAGASNSRLMDQSYAEIDLEVLHREIPGSGSRMDTFFCQPILILNPGMENFKEIQSNLEKRKNSIRGELFRILYTMPVRLFRTKDVLARISSLFTDAVNRFLGPNFEGKVIISQVTFPLFEAPIL